MSHHCVVCAADATKHCAQCALHFYCSEEHQKKHWKLIHKKTCKQPTGLEVFVRDSLKNLIDGLKSSKEFGARAIVEAKRLFLLLHQQEGTKKWDLLLGELATMVGLGYFLCGYWESDWWTVAYEHDSNNVAFMPYFLCEYYGPMPKEGAVSKQEWLDSFVVAKFKQDREKMMALDQPAIRPRSILLFTSVYSPTNTLRLTNGLNYLQATIQENAFAKSNISIVEDAKMEGFDIRFLRDIDADAAAKHEVVFGERVFLIGTASPHDTCFHCASIVLQADQVPCHKCCGFVYCSSICEKRAWKQYHELLCSTSFFEMYVSTCKSIASSSTAQLSSKTCVLYLKLLGMALKLHDPGKLFETEPFCYMSRFRASFVLSAFMHHMNTLYCALATVVTRSEAQKLHSKLATIDSSWMLRAQSILAHNMISVNVERGTLMLGQIAGMLNHSYEPNIQLAERGGCILGVACKPIAKGESLRICYSQDANVLKDVFHVEEE